MKFSIITVCRNDADALEQTIQNVALQNYRDWEYLVIDGQSSDRTKNIVTAAMEQGTVHQFISEPDEGVYDAMNKGLALASGEFVYFLNAGDYFVENTVLEEVADFLTRHPTCDLLYGKINVISQKDGAVTAIAYPEPEQLLDHLAFGWICHQAMFARSQLFKLTGKFDLKFRIAADYDWLFKAIQAKATLGYLPRPIAAYRLGGISDTNQVQSLSEMFEVQNQFPLYQEPQYLHQRVLRLQEAILQLKTIEHEAAQFQEKLQQTRQQLQKCRQKVKTMSDRLNTLEADLEAVTTSKFWKLRSAWMQIKLLLRGCFKS